MSIRYGKKHDPFTTRKKSAENQPSTFSEYRVDTGRRPVVQYIRKGCDIFITVSLLDSFVHIRKEKTLCAICPSAAEKIRGPVKAFELRSINDKFL